MKTVKKLSLGKQRVVRPRLLLKFKDGHKENIYLSQSLIPCVAQALRGEGRIQEIVVIEQEGVCHKVEAAN